ncbi:sensor histidine kinase [Aeromicrobium terrae]|nr:sensor histidine kinase [Aeromicrobium terrae]
MRSPASLVMLPTAEEPFRWGRLLGAGIWLVFLGSPLGAVLDAGGWRQDLGIAGLVLLLLTYLYGLSLIRTIHIEHHYVLAWTLVLTTLVAWVAVVPGAQDQSLTCLVFVAALATSILPQWHGLAVAFAMFVVTTVTGLTVDGWETHGNNFAVVLATAATFSFRLAWQRNARLIAAERELSEMAVEDERSRIARDLHDILGHSLTVISVKAELAGRMMDVDPERARAEIDDLQRLSRDALADVRATAQGIRGISLPGEIASARSALESAGIEPHLPTVADEVPSRWRELYAWTVREGVTNVIRHSGASWCEVEVDAISVIVRDDGVGPVTEGDGSGLEGLRQRARLVGATVITGPGRDGRGFELTVEVPL